MDKTCANKDRLHICRLLVILLPALSLLLLLALGFDCSRRDVARQDVEAAMVRGLSLSNLALAPAGSTRRSPELRNPAVDLRPTPWLFFMDPDPAELLLPSPSCS